ncbi:acyl-coenzyme A oxidase-like protein isoform X4 [Danio rerio]|uniref:Acyl-coenzyme A oxidase-like protein isoform X4 n=1 Tax=Danio rerio TaxID=7955 RepID=A0AC58H390_DANRE
MLLSSIDQMPSSSLARYLDGEFWEIKDAFRDAISKSDLFQSSCYERTLDQNRDLTADRLYHILRQPVMKEHLKNQLKEKQKGFINKSMSITEVVCAADMNTGVKLGVVCGLYGGAVNNLGSPEQKIKFYLPVSELQFTGMFAMTERGHGSNVRGIITEARYDQPTQEFIIHTPSEDAHKMYIGNAMKGNFAAVFAQLIINGESQGPHCFVVPIRDENGVMWPGVTVSDMKHKEGLHGVDNGILIFDNVRIPRENLLGKFGSVSADGLYSSPALRGNRFNAMLAALTPTRLGLTVQAMAAMKLGLIIAVCYSHSCRFSICKAALRTHTSEEEQSYQKTRLSAQGLARCERETAVRALSHHTSHLYYDTHHKTSTLSEHRLNCTAVKLQTATGQPSGARTSDGDTSIAESSDG